MKTVFSQNDEEKLILDFFGDKKGRFLDVGACDGVMVSNTRQIALNGWSGVCIEPGEVFWSLESLYKDNEKITCLNVAIGNQKGIFRFFDSGEGISTFDPVHKMNWEKNGGKYKDTKVYMTTWEDLFNEIGYEFDFISLDTESMNIDLFRTIPLHKLTQVKMIIVEHDGNEVEMCNIAGEYGFNCISRNAENLIFTR